MKFSWKHSPVDDFLPGIPHRGAGLLALFTAVAFVAICTGSIQFHSPIAKANDSGDNNQGGSGVPGAAGYNPTFHREEENYGRSIQVVNVPYGMFPPAVAQYVVGARSVPYGAFAMAPVKVRYARVQPKHVRVVVRHPLNILPPIAVAPPKPHTFASLFGIQ